MLIPQNEFALLVNLFEPFKGTVAQDFRPPTPHKKIHSIIHRTVNWLKHFKLRVVFITRSYPTRTSM